MSFASVLILVASLAAGVVMVVDGLGQQTPDAYEVVAGFEAIFIAFLMLNKDWVEEEE